MRIINFLDHTFLGNYLDENSIILDLGGNKGEFAKKISNDFNCKVFTFEPVQELFESIKETELVKKFKKAVVPKSGELVEINLSDDKCATAYGKTGKVIQAESITIEEILNNEGIASVSLLKIDIEGSEVSILENIKPEILKKIDQVTVEFHDFLWPELKPRVEAIKKKIEKLGYYCIPFSLMTNGDVLFIKKEKLSFLNYIRLKFFTRFMMGAKRKIKKIIS